MPPFVQEILFQLHKIIMHRVKYPTRDGQREIPVFFSKPQKTEYFCAKKIGGRNRNKSPDPSAKQIDDGEIFSWVFGDADGHRDDGPQAIHITLHEDKRPTVFF